jgi:hypothetical protein
LTTDPGPDINAGQEQPNPGDAVQPAKGQPAELAPEARGPSDGAVPFLEALRRQLSNKRRPAEFVLQVRCEKAHPLLWVVPSPWGLVPVTRTSEEPEDSDVDQGWSVPGVVQKTAGPEPGRFTHDFHVELLEPDRPRTLQDWPDDRPLPPASCPCHAEVVLAVPQLREWLSSARRTVTYRRSL